MRFITLGGPVKPCLVKYFKWLLKLIEGQRAHFVFRTDHKGHISGYLTPA